LVFDCPRDIVHFIDQEAAISVAGLCIAVCIFLFWADAPVPEREPQILKPVQCAVAVIRDYFFYNGSFYSAKQETIL
jgi:hypothetical protein